MADDLEVAVDLTTIEREGLHIEDPDLVGAPEFEDADLDEEHLARYGSLEDLVNVFAETYNAHDLDAILELLAPDCELPGLGSDRAGFARICDDVWDRRPNAVLTRGLLGEQPVAILWDVGEPVGLAETNGVWDRVALLAFDRADDDGSIGMVELIEDADLVHAAETDEPEDDLAEGAHWDEWYEGADR